MTGRHTNEDNTSHDVRDEALDALLTGADDDLQDALGATLHIYAGLVAILDTTPPPTLPGPGASGFGRGTVSPFGPNTKVGAGSGMGGMGGRAQQSDDEEHMRASYLIEPDPNEVFGTDECTAPPVIGEENNTGEDRA